MDGGEPGEGLRRVAGRRRESGAAGKPARGTVSEKSSWSTGPQATDSPRETAQKGAAGFDNTKAAGTFCKSSFGGVMGLGSQVALADEMPARVAGF